MAAKSENSIYNPSTAEPTLTSPDLMKVDDVNHDGDKVQKTSLKWSEGSGQPQVSDELNKSLHEINQIVFNHLNYFPIIITLPSINAFIAVLNTFNLPISKTIKLSDKTVANKLIPRLMRISPNIKFDYSLFLSHPGYVFVKNLTKDKFNKHKIFKYFQGLSIYKSLIEVNVFNDDDPYHYQQDRDFVSTNSMNLHSPESISPPSPLSDDDSNYGNDSERSSERTEQDEVYVLLKFANYLDVDHIISKPFNNNPFGDSPLYLNKYINRSQRKLHSEDHDYSTIFIDNLTNILPLEFRDFSPVNYQNSLKKFSKFLEKFKLFSDIKMMYFPVINNTINFGFIQFKKNDLKIIYYLSDLTFEQFMNFEFPLKDLLDDVANPETPEDESDQGQSDTIHLTIAQHKHNHYLYQFSLQYITQNHKTKHLILANLDVPTHHFVITPFLKFINYQETNIYVTNFPIMFNNNDQLWSLFWSKFGTINSAKVIKPQYYSKQNQKLGKIGFVFYKNFKMAIKAILITNNKSINLGNSNSLIKTSFAIQKLHKKSLNAPEQPQNASQVPPPVPIPGQIPMPIPMSSIPVPMTMPSVGPGPIFEPLPLMPNRMTGTVNMIPMYYENDYIYYPYYFQNYYYPN